MTVGQPVAAVVRGERVERRREHDAAEVEDHRAKGHTGGDGTPRGARRARAVYVPTVDDADTIRSLLHSYAELLDAGDLDGVAALFRHATWRSSTRSDVLRGSEQVRDAVPGRDPVRRHPWTRHVISNVTVVCNGSPVATARSYFTVLQAVPGFPLQPVLAGRYHDELERVDGAWRFTDRLILPDLVGDLSHHMSRAR